MKTPWMPLYVGDYIADTRGLSALEHGAYLLLIMEYWQTGRLPDDEVRLARIACVTDKEWRAIRSTLLKFFMPGWKHKRVEEELSRRDVKSDKARESASRRWKDRPPEPPMPTHNERYANAQRPHSERNARGHANGYAKDHANRMLSQSQGSSEAVAGLDAAQPSSREVGLVDRGVVVVTGQRDDNSRSLRVIGGGR